MWYGPASSPDSGGQLKLEGNSPKYFQSKAFFHAPCFSSIFQRFCLSVGWLYTRLVVSNSFARDEGDRNVSERTSLLSARQVEVSDSIQKFMAMYVFFCSLSRFHLCRELHLQIKLLALQDLLEQTEHEPRLKGPFPVQLYRDILTSLQTILDKLHSMRCVTTREEWFAT